MSEATPSGLAGAVSRMAKKTHAFVANPDAWALRLVLFAGVITILKKNYVPGEPFSYAMWFGTSLGIAALMFEMSTIKRAIAAFWQGRLGSMVWSTCMWVVAITFALNQWVGAASENQIEKSNLHAAAFNQSVAAIDNVKELQEQLKIKKGAIDWSKTLDAPESYDARIKAAEADAAYEETKGGCKSKCIAKQQLAASLKAEKANAIERATVQEEIKVLTGKLEDARKVAANTKVETSEKRNDLVVLTEYAGMTERSAQMINGIFSIVAISLFLSYISAMRQIDIERQTGPRRKFGLFGKAYRSIYRLLFGGEPPGTKVIENHHIHTDRPYAQAMGRVAARHGLTPALG